MVGHVQKNFNHARPCFNCGKKAKKLTSSYRSKEPYRGNLMIIRDSSYTLNKGSENESHWYQYSLWDQETYYHKYGLFCTAGCGVQWANNFLERSNVE